MGNKRLPRVVMLSLWRDDTRRGLRGRALHLLSKSYPNLRWVWVEGDSQDDTYEQLLEIINEVHPHRRVDLYSLDTGIVGNDPETRRRRLGISANQWLAGMRDGDDYLLVHESDLLSQADLV